MDYLGEGVNTVGIVKHGTGEVLRDDEGQKTAASKDWSEQDEQALDSENTETDKEQAK